MPRFSRMREILTSNHRTAGGNVDWSAYASDARRRMLLSSPDDLPSTHIFATNLGRAVRKFRPESGDTRAKFPYSSPPSFA